jgi:hypothetical protein
MRLRIDLPGVGNNPLHSLLLAGKTIDAAFVAFVIPDDDVPAAASLVGKGQHHGSFFFGAGHRPNMPRPPGAARANPAVRTDPCPTRGNILTIPPGLPGTKHGFAALRICRSTHGTWGMSPGEVAASYRLYAAYCAEIAQTVTDSARKVALLDMAQAWARLAEHVDKDRPPGEASAATP